jgi:transposase-like protein
VRLEIAEKLTIEAQEIFNGKVYTLIVENTKESPLMPVISNNIKPDGTHQNQLNILRKWYGI